MKPSFLALDLETKSLDPDHEEYALSPWRIMEGKAKVLLVAVGPDHGRYDAFPLAMHGFSVYKDYSIWTWNGVFDIACLIASGIDVSKVKWLDAMSAAKRVFRSQHTDHPNGSRPVSWSLDNMARTQLKGWEHYQEFLDVKKEFSFDETYLRRRCELDTEATLLLGQIFWDKMTEQQRKAFLIESESLYEVALSWMRGARYDFEKAAEMRTVVEKDRKYILTRLIGDHYFDSYTGKAYMINMLYDDNRDILAKAIGSNDKLATLMYDVWRIPFDEDLRNPKAKTDKRPVNKGVLTFLIERYGTQFPQIALIKRYRELKSKEDKFLKGPLKTREYLGCDVMRHMCKINSTYTGRTTYGSKQ